MSQLMLMLMVAVLVVIAPAGGLSADGPDEQWNKTFGGPASDLAYSVQQTSDGGIILAGTTHSYGTGFDPWLIKTDANGNELWNRTYGGSGHAYSVQQTSDGGYILAGILESDGLLIKTDENGNEQWSRTLGPGFVNSVQQTLDGGFALAGYKDLNRYDAWMIKTDINGNEQWNKTFGGRLDERANSHQQTSDGGFILAGYTVSYATGGNFDSWLVKTDINGNELWNKTFGGESYDMSNSVQQTSDGGFILAGSTESYGAGKVDAWLIKTDINGTEQWNKTLGDIEGDAAHFIQQTSDGGFILAGGTNSYGAGNLDAWLIKVREETPPSGFTVGQGAPTTAIEQLFIDAYNRNGGVDVLSDPATEVHDTWGYLVQDFPGANGYAGGIIMYNPNENSAYYIHGKIWDRYYSLGGPIAQTDIEFQLGLPINDVLPYVHSEPPLISSHGSQFRYQNFAGETEMAALEYNLAADMVYEIHGAIYATWSAMGYADSILGLVTSDEREAVPSFKGTTGRLSDFENGHLHWHSSADHVGTTYMTYT